jgi:glutathione synthase/RimK-type ligase-like ATP-grasp enzyme
MAKKLLHIGTIELVSLPDDQVRGIPAKIDTGADGSAIWASNIKQKDGKLTFNLFAPGSAYYSKRVVTTTAYKTTSVKNSFGHKELRYKIRLNVQVGEHVVREWFSLADRSRNTFPILLGKNFLKNRFVVDVSRQYLVSKGVASHKVLVVDRSPNLTAEFFAKVKQQNKLNLDYAATSFKSLLYYLEGTNTEVTNTKEGEDLAYYTLTYFKSHTGYTEFAAAAAEYLQFKGRPFVDRELANYISDSKLTESTKLACYNLPIPPTICAQTALLSEQFDTIKKTFGLPFVLKEIASDRGRNNYLVSSRKQFDEILDRAPKEHVYLAQKYIENNALVRVYVTGSTATLAIKKSAEHHTGNRRHITKFSSDGEAKVVKVSEEMAELAVQAAKCLERQVAGVDIVRDIHSKKWYILEVNSAPQIRSGSQVDAKAAALAQFFDKELSR